MLLSGNNPGGARLIEGVGSVSTGQPWGFMLLQKKHRDKMGSGIGGGFVVLCLFPPWLDEH